MHIKAGGIPVMDRVMPEEKAAVIIQRHCRGYLTRRNLEFRQYLSNRWLSGRLVERVIDEALQNDVIPDVLMEVLQERMSCGGWVCCKYWNRTMLATEPSGAINLSHFS